MIKLVSHKDSIDYGIRCKKCGHFCSQVKDPTIYIDAQTAAKGVYECDECGTRYLVSTR